MDLENFNIPSAITMFINIASRARPSKEATMNRAHKIEAFSNIPLLIRSISISVSFQGHMQDINDEKHLEEGANDFKRLFSTGLKSDIYGIKKQEDKAI